LYGKLPVINIVCNLFIFSLAELYASCCVFPKPEPDTEIVKKVAEADPWMKEHLPEIERAMFVKSADIDINHPLIQTLSDAYKAVTDEEPVVMGETCAYEQRLLVHDADTPTILFGVAGGEAHSPNEFLAMESLITVTKSIAITIIDWCGIAE